MPETQPNLPIAVTYPQLAQRSLVRGANAPVMMTELRQRVHHPVLRWLAASRLHVRDADPNPSTISIGCHVAAAFAAFLAALAGHPPRPIPVDADAIDLEDRAEHLSAVFGGLTAYLALILDDTAQNAPGGLDFTDAEAILADLASDLTGIILNAADEMAGRVE